MFVYPSTTNTLFKVWYSKENWFYDFQIEGVTIYHISEETVHAQENAFIIFL